jgi:Xaa-Pro aminopeptidase
MRLGDKTCHSLSFPTISAMGENAAVIHYRPSKNDDKPLCPGLYLVDSGGQYNRGTTDVTRTILLGKEEIPHEVLYQYKTIYTSVLKGMIDLSLAVFPKNTTGAQLDILARRYLYTLGLDYPHGTGHGVGSYLNVHEGPIGIGRGAHTPLEEGMVLSNEPGYYEPYQFGIRLENMMLVEKRGDFLGFRTLTQVPFDHDLIDRDALEKQHEDFLKNYPH